MRNLSPPQLVSEEVYRRIKKNARDEDKKRRLNIMENLIFSRYSIYESNTATLELIEDSNIIDKEDALALESCYTRNKDGYLEGEVVARIIALQSPQHKNSCPYCGMDKPRTIDHYLPKSVYPEFAIFPPNLIPCCGHCNGKKGVKWLLQGKRRFLNFYYDDIPDEKFLHASLLFDEDKNKQVPKVLFELKNNKQINEEMFYLISNHFKELDLLKELSEFVEEELSNIYDEIRHNTHLSQENHIENLTRKKDSCIRKYGMNYWRSALYETIIDSDELFDRIYNHPL
ncbi:HNH endonuclease [Paenibacillus chitinolyticus]|uniref:HNH endonuclease n=1 Tax=Paenibacillus chitinolyticus TaxID=79263 RepID=UPI003669C8ED